MNSRKQVVSGGHLTQHKTKGGALKKTLAAGMGVALIAGAGLGAAASASAASPQNRTGLEIQAGPSGSGTTWLGSMWLNDNGGQEAWCIEWGTPEQPVTVAPTAATQANVNYQITTYKNGTADDQAAVAYNVHQQMSPAGAVETLGLFLNGSAQGDAVKARASQIQAEADTNVGPYKMTPQLSLGSDGRTGTVNATQLITGNGTKLSGKTATAVLAGPALFANGSKTMSFKTGDSLAFNATGSGRVSVTTTVSGLPGASVNTYRPANSQDMVTPGPTVNASGVSGDVEVVFDFQPKATSTAVKYVEAGDGLTDVLHVSTSTGSANDWAFVDGKNVPAIFDVDWYYSPVKLDPSPKVPASATLYTSGQGTATDVGDITVTGAKKAAQAGYYYPVAKFSKASQPENLRPYFTADWSAGFNDPNEQSIQKYQPKFGTVSSEIVDGKIHDVIEVTGNDPDAELSIESTLYLTQSGPVAGGTATLPEDAINLGTVTTKIKGNGTFKTPSIEIPWEKVIEQWGKTSDIYVTWAESATGTISTKPVTPRPLQPTETIKLPKPTIITQASENGVVPLDMNDTGIITGTLPSGPGVKVETKVEQFKFDNSTDGSAQAVCVNPSYESPWQEVTTTTVTYPTHRTEFVGTYGYVETLKVGITKDGKTTETVLHTGKCGEKNETVIAFPKDVPPTPEKPELVVPPAPEKPKAPVVPEVPAGNIVTTSQNSPNTGLLIGGGALALTGMALAGTMIIRRRNNALANSADVQ